MVPGRAHDGRVSGNCAHSGDKFDHGGGVEGGELSNEEEARVPVHQGHEVLLVQVKLVAADMVKWIFGGGWQQWFLLLSG